MKVHRSNLISALTLAIAHQTATEMAQGFTGPSALVGGWIEVLRELQRDGEIEFYPSSE